MNNVIKHIESIALSLNRLVKLEEYKILQSYQPQILSTEQVERKEKLRKQLWPRTTGPPPNPFRDS